MVEVDVDIESFKSLDIKQLKLLDAVRKVDNLHINLRMLSDKTGLPQSTVWDTWQKLQRNCKVTMKIEPLSAKDRLESEKNGKKCKKKCK